MHFIHDFLPNPTETLVWVDVLLLLIDKSLLLIKVSVIGSKLKKQL